MFGNEVMRLGAELCVQRNGGWQVLDQPAAFQLGVAIDLSPAYGILWLNCEF
jgi:hypothetical protein